MNGRFPYPVLCGKLPHCRAALRVGRPDSLGVVFRELGASSSAYWGLPLWRAVPGDMGERDTPGSVADGTPRDAVLTGQRGGSDGTLSASLADFYDKYGGQCLHVFLFSEGREGGRRRRGTKVASYCVVRAWGLSIDPAVKEHRRRVYAACCS